MLISWREVVRASPPIRGVIHIGAHRAEEGGDYRAHGIKHILWIEADPRKVGWLKEHVNEPVLNYAICGEDDVQLDLHLSTNDGASSSLLQPKEHLFKHPGVGFSGTVEVRGITLDTLLRRTGVDPKLHNFISIDIQGAELLALKGATATLPHTDAIYTEVNFIEMYKGCGLVGELDEFLAEYGFQRRLTHDTGLGWGDALYIKPRPDSSL